MMLIYKDGRYILYPRYDIKRAGQICFFIGLALAVIITVLPVIFTFAELLLLEVIPGVFIIVGGIFAMTGKKVVIDPGKEIVEKGGLVFGFDDIGAFNINSYEIHTRNGIGRRWILSLLKKGNEQNIKESVAEIRRLVENSLKDEKEVPQDVKKRAAKIMNNLLRSNLRGIVTIADDYRELKLRQLAKRLARLIKVPVYDLSGELPEVRGTDELDMLFTEKLKSGRVEIEEPAPGIPAGMYESLEGRELIIGFNRTNDGLIALGMVFGFLSWICFLVFMLTPGIPDYITLTAFIIAVLSSFSIFAGFRLARDGIISLLPGRLKYCIKGSGSVIHQFDFSEIESINLDTSVSPSISFISDRKIYRITLEKARRPWVYNKICKFLLDN
jgi:hypothetical protein